MSSEYDKWKMLECKKVLKCKSGFEMIFIEMYRSREEREREEWNSSEKGRQKGTKEL